MVKSALMHLFRIGYVITAVALCSALLAQGNEEARLRSLNAELLRLRGLLYSASASEQGLIRSQASPVFDQRQTLLEALMSSQPLVALQLAFPADVLADLASSFPQSAAKLETRGSWQGPLYYFVEDGVGLQSYR